ncbi:MAG: hypothetical protein PHT78_12610 [Desulfitobacteriaceae bacterium]|nr:hypothetical protein [Desulfitobacteriaceae bacterium]
MSLNCVSTVCYRNNVPAYIGMVDVFLVNVTVFHKPDRTAVRVVIVSDTVVLGVIFLDKIAERIPVIVSRYFTNGFAFSKTIEVIGIGCYKAVVR